MSYVNLHVHSHFSLLDGFGSPMAIVKRAKELGSTAIALTDHGVTYGLLEFYKAANAEGIKPLLGCELYVAPRTRFDKDATLDRKSYHLTAFAKNNVGYQNLLKLISKANLEGFYYKPRVDYDLLREFGEGLVILSGCIAGHLPKAILSEDEDEIRRLVELHIDIFGKENYFLELQDHPLIEYQGIVNEKLKSLSKEYGLDLVATNDSHYPTPADSDVHDILLCIQTQTTIDDPNRMKYTGDFSMRTHEDMLNAFSDVPEAVANTVKIADMCNVSFDFGHNLIPSFETPDNILPEKHLLDLCNSGLKARFPDASVPDDYLKRLDYELDLVHSMGFDTYFLIVSDFVDYAKRSGIVVGPGRGSAAGSIIAWALKITDIDPIKYGLFFERFLNPERISMPDIDIDFADHRRDEVIDYVVKKYGRNNVAQIITFGTMAPRAAVRDAGRALGYPYQEVDKIAKTIPPPVLGKYSPLKESVIEDSELSYLYTHDPRAKIVLDYASRLEGTVRHSGTHACAVVIAEKPLTEYTALQRSSSEEGIVTQYQAGDLESLGLLKMDFLGLRNLTIIERTMEFIKQRHGVDIDIHNLPLDDEKTFQLLQRGDTIGVFQLESAGMRRYLKELKPTEFEDIVAMGALYRPGPMEWIPTYIAGKRNPEKVEYLHESFKSILASTYSVAVYQEQILQLARDFAGFSLGEADILRKAVGKKIASLLVEQRDKFIAGAVAKGHDRKFAKEVFEKIIEPFAGYGFNRAHAVCYAMIAYQTAYLKAHYSIEFMTALLYSDAGNTDRVVLDIQECSEMGIEVLPPNINESFEYFSIVDGDKIRFGLNSIKGVGNLPVSKIVAEREANGVFKSLVDFAKRVDSKVLNKKVVESLAYAGALDDLGDRDQIAENYSEISKFSKNLQDIFKRGQTDIFGAMDDNSEAETLHLRPVPKSTRLNNLAREKTYLGLYVSGHPLRGLSPYISRKARLISQLKPKHIDKVVKICGLVSDLRRLTTKTGGHMAVFVVEDPTAKLNIIIFPRQYQALGSDLSEGAVVLLSGKLTNRRDILQVTCNTLKILSLSAMLENAKEADLYDPDEKGAAALRFIDDILAEELRDSAELVGVDDGSDSCESSSCSSFRIDVPSSVTVDQMTDLKELLLNNRGNRKVDLFLTSSSKTIRLPFKVGISDDLQAKIAKIFS